MNPKDKDFSYMMRKPKFKVGDIAVVAHPTTAERDVTVGFQMMDRKGKLCRILSIIPRGYHAYECRIKFLDDGLIVAQAYEGELEHKGYKPPKEYVPRYCPPQTNTKPLYSAKDILEVKIDGLPMPFRVIDGPKYSPKDGWMYKLCRINPETMKDVYSTESRMIGVWWVESDITGLWWPMETTYTVTDITYNLLEGKKD